MTGLAAVAAFGALIMLPADAGQPYRQTGSPAPTCDNDSGCTALNAPAPMSRTPFGAGQKTRNTVVRVPNTKGSAVGVVVSSKTGARARVGTAYAARFQAYIDDLEDNYGVRVLFMSGIRRGRCSISSEHPCGKALDVCQLRRGVVDPRCHLPSRLALDKIAISHGLFEGGRWCDSDYGHAQIDVTAGTCGDRRTRNARQ
jgi:hypothetical protein